MVTLRIRINKIESKSNILWKFLIAKNFFLNIVNMRLIAKKNINTFCEKNPEFKTQLEIWNSEVRSANWENPQDVIFQFPKASVLKNGRIVFRKGNKFRIIAFINYSRKIVYLCFLGTHAEYDKIDAETVRQF
ncbi:MAG: mRNA interferase HigB [Saprospiraceae bacterium]